MDSKLNRLLKQWPKGTVATSSWLSKQGVYRQLVRQYVASKWLEPLGHGAFVHAGEKSDWLGGLYALQAQLGMGIYVAASTALSLKGLGHFLPLGENSTVLLFGERREKLPAWFARHAWGVRISYNTPHLFETSEPAGFTTVEHGAFTVRVAAPERAMLEVCHIATTNAAIDHALELMAGLNTLRPQVVQSLLEECRSVKVKRMFLWAAKESGHAWGDRLDIDRLHLGSGKRQIYRGGQLDTQYQITVPRKDEAHV